MSKTFTYVKYVESTYGKLVADEYLTVPVYDCPTCNGGDAICYECNGFGRIQDGTEEQCELCNGTGKCPTCHGYGYIESADNILIKLLTLTPEEAPSCPDCGHPNNGTIAIRRANTAYVNDVCNWDICCLVCYEDHQAYWAERWEDYNGGRL